MSDSADPLDALAAQIEARGRWLAEHAAHATPAELADLQAENDAWVEQLRHERRSCFADLQRVSQLHQMLQGQLPPDPAPVRLEG
jgi:hypothetical protein